MELQIVSEQRCNFRCRHCDIRADGPKASWDRGIIYDVIKDYASCFPGEKVFIGVSSEPLLDPAWTFAVAEACHANGLRACTVSNGSLVMRHIEQIPYYLDDVTISLDYPDDRHDLQRGHRGAFKAACEAIQALSRAGVTVGVSSIASMATVASLRDVYDLTRSLGASKMSVSMIQPKFRGEGICDGHVWGDTDWVIGHLRRLPFVSKAWLALARMYIDSKVTDWDDRLLRPACGAVDRMIVLGLDGLLRPCHAPETLGVPWAGPGSIRTYLDLYDTDWIRESVYACRKPCGISLCACRVER